MTEQPENAFIGRTEAPDEAALAAALGPAKPVWDGLIAEMAEHEVTVPEWKSYRPKYGWSMRLARKKRTILWLAPCAGGCFQVMFILGEKAMKAARECGLSASARKILEEAPKYPEGTGIRLLIRGPKDLATVRKLAVVKLAN